MEPGTGFCKNQGLVLIMILFVDTTGRQLFLELFNQQGFVSCKIIEDAGRHSKALIPAVQTMFAEHQIKIKDLTAIAVVSGPGSFTGIRIGLSFVKGVSLALQIPILSFSSLQIMALAHNFSEHPYCLARIHARLEESYAAIYYQSVHQCILAEGVYEQKILDVKIKELNTQVGSITTMDHHEMFHSRLFNLIKDRLQQTKLQSSQEVQANYLRLAAYKVQMTNG